MRGLTVLANSTAPFSRVLRHIDEHLDGDLSLTRLSAVARISRFYFHHRFTALFDVSLHQYITLARLRRAAYELLFRPRRQVIEVALSSGYGSAESFTRAFTKHVGLSPSRFRARPDWASWRALNETVVGLRARCDVPPTAGVVRVERVAPLRLAVFEVRGQPLRLGHALQQFIAWRMEHGLSPDRSATFSVFPAPGRADAIDLCAAITRPVRPNPLGIVEKRLRGGRCALLRHVGPYASLFEAARWLATTWLAASGEQLREAPLVIRRITLFPDVAENAAVSEIALPLTSE